MAKSLSIEELEKVKLLYASGETTHAIAQKLGRSQHTIQKAIQKEGVLDDVKEIKKSLIEKFENLADRLIESITQADIEKSTMLQRVTASGIAIDKSRLLSNQSTSNEAHVIILNVPNTEAEYKIMCKNQIALQGESDD